jgi:CheY-like chemotaxis protein
MNNSGPIIVIEDDLDDQEMLEQVFSDLGHPNEIIFFSDGYKALDYLNAEERNPFIILSDINMPKLDGFELRRKIKQDANLQVKCIPYIFFSTAVSQQAVINAYSESAQGFFVKQNTYKELTKTISCIMEYWLRCSAPNRFKDN